MRFLVDENLPPLVAAGLTAAGHDAVHARDAGLAAATDQTVLDVARREQRVIVSADTDFGALVAAGRASAPSIVLIRRAVDRRAGRLVDLLLANLDQVADSLAEGAVVVLEADRVRVRRLPLV